MQISCKVTILCSSTEGKKETCESYVTSLRSQIISNSEIYTFIYCTLCVSELTPFPKDIALKFSELAVLFVLLFREAHYLSGHYRNSLGDSCWRWSAIRAKLLWEAKDNKGTWLWAAALNCSGLVRSRLWSTL